VAWIPWRIQDGPVFFRGQFRRPSLRAHTYENAGSTKEALEESEIYGAIGFRIPPLTTCTVTSCCSRGAPRKPFASFSRPRISKTLLPHGKYPAQYDWHHGHNLQLLALSYQSLGQMKSAEATFRGPSRPPATLNFSTITGGYGRSSCWIAAVPGSVGAARDLQKSEWPMTGSLDTHWLSSAASLNRTSEAQEETR